MRILLVGLLLGFLFNLFGWLGNVFVLGAMWNDATLIFADVPWRNSPWRDAVSLVPDFIYGVAVAWLYAGLSRRYGASATTGLRAILLVFLVGAFTTYLGIANSAFLSWTLAAATTLLALVVFLPGAWLVDRLLRDHVTRGQR
ncbi:MAG TPA: hypothetical protein VLB07_10860 [Woeseiaceae bacterium]|nr:hypothetical protein [Woeseiaceae bacterium]